MLQPNGAATATTRNRIARVNANGSLDTGFDPKADNAVTSLVVQADVPADPPLTLRELVEVTQPAAQPVEFHCYRTDIDPLQAVRDTCPAEPFGLPPHSHSVLKQVRE